MLFLFCVLFSIVYCVVYFVIGLFVGTFLVCVVLYYLFNWIFYDIILSNIQRILCFVDSKIHDVKITINRKKGDSND